MAVRPLLRASRLRGQPCLTFAKKARRTARQHQALSAAFSVLYVLCHNFLCVARLITTTYCQCDLALSKTPSPALAPISSLRTLRAGSKIAPARSLFARINICGRLFAQLSLRTWSARERPARRLGQRTVLRPSRPHYMHRKTPAKCAYTAYRHNASAHPQAPAPAAEKSLPHCSHGCVGVKRPMSLRLCHWVSSTGTCATICPISWSFRYAGFRRVFL